MIGAAPGVADGPVIYWMRTAVRGHENPALDVAITLADAAARPLLVYHALDERYPYASDRHHTFILQGARDVARDLAARGVPYAFHLARPGHRDAHLADLARRAAVVVTEAFPLDPLRAWTARLVTLAPVVEVDTACVVPMAVVGRAYDRAFAFERATAAEAAARVPRSWVDVAPRQPLRPPPLPWTPLDVASLDDAALATLVATCAIDHGVGPVAHTRGGSGAGYARWQAFVADGLARYDQDRNHPLAGGVSRMSAYLHYGMVAPTRLAREAAAIGGAGATKYLNELLVWREVAYALAAFAPDGVALDDVAILPAWARATLAAHAHDPRPQLPTWEALARGRTGDVLWDAAQASLRIHGELHNNVRMTWGKALPSWTPDAATALAMLVDLNHRFALDGRDPASFGGLLWCLGMFDRPFTPAVPILGEVRPRPSDAHAARLDVAAYAAHTGRPAGDTLRSVIVVGAGLAGLICARTLADHGLRVTIVDKGRGPGGRTSTRRTDDGRTFDHGAPGFALDDPRLARLATSWRDAGVVATWTPRGGATRWVGTPRMSSLASHLARDLDLRVGQQVAAIEATAPGWHVRLADGTTLSADAVVVATPATQAADLLATSALGARLRAAATVQTPCWAAMLALRGDVGDLDVLTPSAAIATATRDDRKPQRRAPADESWWTVHATAAWSAAHLEAPAADIADRLGTALLDSLGLAPSAVSIVHAVAHRWRYAGGAVAADDGTEAWFDASTRLAIAGDWVVDGTVDGALRSGLAAAGRILSAGG